MAAGTWKVYTQTKRNIGSALFDLDNAAGPFYMTLHRTSASATITKFTNGGISTYASIGSEVSATGGYVAAGTALSSVAWTVGANNSQMKWTYTTGGVIFTGSLNNVRYAAIRNSTGAGAGRVLCYVALSTTQFSLVSPNTLTVIPAATGVFTLT